MTNENEYGRVVPQAVRADKRWQEAMRRRGIIDLNNVVVDAWPPGYFAIPEDEGRRLAKALFYYRGTAQNQYGRPIEGVVAVVDVATGEVLRVVDTGVVPLPAETADLDSKSIGKQQQAPKPLEIAQPKGSSFEIAGNAVRWQNWHFRFGFNPREGVVLYTVGYEEDGKIRSVLYRGSVSELAMFYADPSPAWFFRNVFDEGEVGLGLLTASLEPGADAPANAVFVDGLMPTESGGTTQVPRAMALFERDAGILWKHNELEGGHNETRRARELVLSSVATISNYDYCFNWVFHQDGVLEMEVILTGIVEPQGVSPGSTPKFAQRLTRNLAAVHHQHWFNFRLDLDVDGAAGNSVVEMNAETLPADRDNPYNRAFVEKETTLATEREAQRQLNEATGRMWKVINTGVRNALGEPVGYALVTGENCLPFLPADSWPRKRMGYVNAHLWVTPYEPDELYATGDYPYQGKADGGLPKWTSANRSIANKDVVLWYTMGVSHATHDGRALRILVVIDEYTRECLGLRVARRLGSLQVIETLADVMLVRGIPQHIRSDNGPEFIAEELRRWLGKLGTKTLYIEPGSPWENGYCESLNGKLRDEFLNGEIFYSLKEARILTERWRVEYNTQRPHSALGYRPPAPQAILPGQPGHGDMENAPRFPHPHTPGDDCGQMSNEALH